MKASNRRLFGDGSAQARRHGRTVIPKSFLCLPKFCCTPVRFSGYFKTFAASSSHPPMVDVETHTVVAWRLSTCLVIARANSYEACAARLCSHTFSVGLNPENLEDANLGSCLLCQRARRFGQKRALAALCMEVTFKCRLLGLFLASAVLALM